MTNILKNLKILILEGGFNEEHEISLQTSKEVKKSLNRLNIFYESIIVNPSTFENEINNYSNDFICFNALHGPFGEDGQIQHILNKKNFKYTHSGEEASHIAFNKKLTKDKIKNLEILTPNFLSIDIDQINEQLIIEFFLKEGPIIIKPISSGSSFGIKIFYNISEIKIFFQNLITNLEIYKNHKNLLIEKYINGRELTVSVLQKKNTSHSINVTEILSNNKFFDYESKYTPGFSKHVIPADIPSEIYKTCMNHAKLIHDKINCKGVSRSDFLFHKNKIYFLEINSQPGLTAVSLVPEQLSKKDISFDDLILHLIKSAK